LDLGEGTSEPRARVRQVRTRAFWESSSRQCSTPRVSRWRVLSRGRDGLARQPITVASRGAFRMRRLLEAWIQEREQARGRFDGDRCFARRSDAVARRALTRRVASTIESPGGCSGVTLAMRALVVSPNEQSLASDG
jgi:anti-sigma factor RsiW